MDEPRRLILRNFQSPGDIVMLTAAVRDLHAAYPDGFLTDVRTPCPQLWENNPHISRIADDDPRAEHIDCHYPLIHSSNQLPHHFVQGFTAYLAGRLGLPIKTTAFKGDIHLAQREKSWISQVQETVGIEVPFWIVVAGGKRDFTIKWWSHDRFQSVVDHFRGKVLFVQVGEAKHHHPPLRGVLNLIGKTDLRQLVRLIYHSQGILCPVTLHMHLSAAIEVKHGKPKNRPCVVVAGGREPPHWEAYPHHQFIHTIGALLCCDNGGCWKARTEPLGDGDEKDKPAALCVNRVGDLPRCMDMITAREVVQRIERYFKGGVARYLTESERVTIDAALARSRKAAVQPNGAASVHASPVS
jgi:ADP-heptose:LPS heptosyltransferase